VLEIFSGKRIEIDIKATDGFRLGSIHVDVISDKAVRNDEKGKTFRRLRGRFIDISKVQQLKLQNFL